MLPIYEDMLEANRLEAELIEMSLAESDRYYAEMAKAEWEASQAVAPKEE